MTEKTKTTQDGAVELEESTLEGVAGGLEMFPKSWKMAVLDGKSNDLLTEEITTVADTIKRS